LYTRWFKIDSKTFFTGIREMLGTNTARPLLDTTLQTPSRSIELPPVRRTNERDVLPPRGNSISGATLVPTLGDEVVADARRLFSIAGVDFAQPGKALVYNERLGMLMFRATLQELDLIEQ